jgi:hypothetical protein
MKFVAGRLSGPLKDVAYQMRTPDFWNSDGHDWRKEELHARIGIQ